MLLLTDVFFAAVYSCWKCWTNSSGNDAIEKALLPLYILMTAGYVQFLKHSARIHARSYRYIENKKEIWMPFSFICYKYEKLIDIKITRYLKNKFIIFLTFFTDYSYDENDYSGMAEFTFNLDDYLN